MMTELNTGYAAA